MTDPIVCLDDETGYWRDREGKYYSLAGSGNGETLIPLDHKPMTKIEWRARGQAYREASEHLLQSWADNAAERKQGNIVSVRLEGLARECFERACESADNHNLKRHAISGSDAADDDDMQTCVS